MNGSAGTDLFLIIVCIFPSFSMCFLTKISKVKGPNDRLSDRQTAWLRILQRAGARVGVCHVTEGDRGSHVMQAVGTKKKKRKKEKA